MKFKYIYFGITTLGFSLLISSFTLLPKINATQKNNTAYRTVLDDTIPALNKGILTFVNLHLHKTVGSGECWDLAAIPLRDLHAKWDRQYVFGKLLRPSRDSVLPGDIIQFDGVVITNQIGNATTTSYLTQHTAIIYKVLGSLKYVLAQQNTSDFGRTVSLGEIDLTHLVKGRFMIYRPVE